jgi:hypothetical protein
MQQFKQILFVFILIAVIFVSGCINMDINQKIKSDGNSEIEIVYDLSAIPEMMMSFDSGLGQQENMSDFEENFTQICTKFYEETEWKNATCRTTDDYKIVMSGEIQNNPFNPVHNL